MMEKRIKQASQLEASMMRSRSRIVTSVAEDLTIFDKINKMVDYRKGIETEWYLYYQKSDRKQKCHIGSVFQKKIQVSGQKPGSLTSHRVCRVTLLLTASNSLQACCALKINLEC